MKPLVLVALMVFLSGCASGRHLSVSERAMAADIFGPSLDANEVRVKKGFRGAPTNGDGKPPPERIKIQHRPGVCDRVNPNPPKGPPPAWALYNSVHFSKDWYRDDLAPGWPDRILLPQSLILAHELVHVWQWQNRKITGYRPAKAGLESVLNKDPYFYKPKDSNELLEFGYEQQASLLEDYLCYAVFDPDNERRKRIKVILDPHFKMDRIDALLIQP